MDKIFRSEVLNSSLYTVAAESGIKLNQNEMPWDLPVEIKVAVSEALLKSPWNRYPLDESIQLKKKLSKTYGLWPDQVVLANGSNVLIQALITATSIGRKVMILDPCFSVYEYESSLFANKIIKVALREDFSLPLEKVLSAIRKEKPGLIFIANPNAPTGNLFEKASLHQILNAAPGLVVIDEAYYPFSNETIVDWLADFRNLVVMRTFSKAYALAGVRFGLVYCDAEIAAQLEKMLLPFCVSRLTLVVIDEILKRPQYTENFVRQITKERDLLYHRLQEIEPVQVFPSHANFLLFKTENAKQLYQKLVKAGVLVRNVSNEGSLKNCLRVSIGTHEENLAFLKALKNNL